MHQHCQNYARSRPAVAGDGLPYGPAMAAQHEGRLLALAPSETGIGIAHSASSADGPPAFDFTPPTGDLSADGRASFTGTKVLTTNDDDVLVVSHEYPFAMSDGVHGSNCPQAER